LPNRVGGDQQQVGDQNDDDLKVLEFWPKRSIFRRLVWKGHRTRKDDDFATAAGETGNIAEDLQPPLNNLDEFFVLYALSFA